MALKGLLPMDLLLSKNKTMYRRHFITSASLASCLPVLFGFTAQQKISLFTSKKYAYHSSFYGWYFPHESAISPFFADYVVYNDYVRFMINT